MHNNYLCDLGQKWYCQYIAIVMCNSKRQPTVIRHNGVVHEMQSDRALSLETYIMRSVWEFDTNPYLSDPL